MIQNASPIICPEKPDKKEASGRLVEDGVGDVMGWVLPTLALFIAELIGLGAVTALRKGYVTSQQRILDRQASPITYWANVAFFLTLSSGFVALAAYLAVFPFPFL